MVKWTREILKSLRKGVGVVTTTLNVNKSKLMAWQFTRVGERQADKRSTGSLVSQRVNYLSYPALLSRVVACPWFEQANRCQPD